MDDLVELIDNEIYNYEILHQNDLEENTVESVEDDLEEGFLQEDTCDSFLKTGGWGR